MDAEPGTCIVNPRLLSKQVKKARTLGLVAAAVGLAVARVGVLVAAGGLVEHSIFNEAYGLGKGGTSTVPYGLNPEGGSPGVDLEDRLTGSLLAKTTASLRRTHDPPFIRHHSQFF